MDGEGRLSAAEKGKQKAADADLPPAPLVLQSDGESRPPAGDAAAAANNWHAGGAGACLGVPGHLLLGGSIPTSGGGASEIEELPPSPPPPSRRLPSLLNLNADGALMSAAGPGPELAGLLEGRMMEMEAAMDRRVRELERLRRLRLGESEGGRCRRECADEPPEVAGAEVRLLQHHQAVSRLRDTMLALQFQAQERRQALEEFWKPVVPGVVNKENKGMLDLEEFWKPVVPVPQRNNNNDNSRKFVDKEMQMQALKEFWKPVTVPQRRNNSKIKWKRIISLMASASWVVLCISSWTRLSVNSNLTHIVGAMSVLWMLRGTYSRCQRFRTSRTISRHVPRLICVCFWLLVLYVLFLILRPIHGTFVGWLGKHH